MLSESLYFVALFAPSVDFNKIRVHLWHDPTQMIIFTDNVWFNDSTSKVDEFII